MLKMMSKKALVSFFLCVLLAILLPAEAARFQSLAPVVDVMVDGQEVQEHTVICSDDTMHKIQRPSGTRKWCAKDQATTCFPDRMRVARAVCQQVDQRDNASQMVTAAKPVLKQPAADTADTPSALRQQSNQSSQAVSKEQDLHLELVSIEQRRLSLKSQMDELDAQRLALERRRESLE